jgi:hypothetical protein
MGTLNIDRYHATMGDASYKEASRLRDLRDELTSRMLEDNSGGERVLRPPDSPAEPHATPREADRTTAN